MRYLFLALLFFSNAVAAQTAILQCNIKRTIVDIRSPYEPKSMGFLEETIDIAVDIKKEKLVSISGFYLPGCNPSEKELEISTGCACKFSEQHIECDSSTKTSINEPTINHFSGINQTNFAINRYTGGFSGRSTRDGWQILRNSLEKQRIHTMSMYDGVCKTFTKKLF